MKVTRIDGERGLLLKIDETLDALTTPAASTIFDAVVAERPRRVTLDLANLTHLDSSGVGALVSLCKRVKTEGGDFVVVRVREQPKMVLQLLELELLFGIAA